MSEKDGGSAFPLEVDGWAHHGMTLRDYFAAQAVSNINVDLSNSSPAGVAALVYEIADAMLKERS